MERLEAAHTEEAKSNICVVNLGLRRAFSTTGHRKPGWELATQPNRPFVTMVRTSLMQVIAWKKKAERDNQLELEIVPPRHETWTGVYSVECLGTNYR